MTVTTAEPQAPPAHLTPEGILQLGFAFWGSKTLLSAVEETESARVSYERAHVRVAILDQAVQSSARAAALAQQRFEAGLTDFLQVLDAQRTLLEAENQLALGHTAASTALIAVYKAVGGMWPGRSIDDVRK